MRKIAVFLIIFILVSTSVFTIQEQAYPQIKSKNNKAIDMIISQTTKPFEKDIPTDYFFNPEDIELKDDAFHGSNSINTAEWWYFDAIFANGYSAVIVIYVFDILNQNFVVTGVNICKDGISTLSSWQYYIFNKLDISTENPYVAIDGKQFMKGYIDKVSGDWIYDITIENKDVSVDLQYIGKSKGWKGDLSIGGWAAILPKAEVSGKINLRGTKYDVIGIGYHDHNWGMNIFDLLHFGWYWGRIHLENMTVVWFVILNTRFDSENICIISKDDGGYININPKDIQFSAEEYGLDTIWFYPKTFILMFNIEEMYLAIAMNTISVDSDYKINGHYWRYYLNCYGNTIIDNETKDISGIQIAEFMRFR